jgi:outer membrane protein assembly factor BamD (BamD/ComL family)
MSSFADVMRRLGVALLLGACLGSIRLAGQSPEEFARRRLESGRAFLKAQNYVEALKDFEAILQSYPASSVADDALLEIATYQLQVARDPAAADVRAKELLKVYPASDSAAMALVLEGRISLTAGRGPEDVNAALASFDRVPRLFPGSEAVPASMYFAGEAARLGGRRDQAIQRFSQLATQFPTSPWTANALLGSALSLTRAGQAGRAIEQLQRVRNQFPRSAEALVALDWNTVLYRLYVRVPAQSAFLFSGRTIAGPAGKLKDVVDIAVDRDNNLLVASNTGVATYGSKGTTTSMVASAEPRAVSFDRLGKFITVHETGLRVEGRTPVPLTPPMSEGHVRELKLADALVTASGDYLVADRNQKGILRFSRDGKFVSEYAGQIDVRRMAINDLDEVVALDGDRKVVVLFSREGKILKQISERGTTYQFRTPSAVAFDPVGHIYVLDRAAVLVFSPDGSKLLTTFTVPEKTQGAIGNGRALALDTAGRLFVFDEGSDSVKVYR